MPNVSKAHKSFWTHPMVLVGDEAEVEAHFGAFGDSGNLDVDRCMVCAERTIASEIVLDELLGDGIMWNLVSVRLETVFVLVQDRWFVPNEP